MRVAVASDHAGFPLKTAALEYVASLGHETLDLGTYDEDPVDYPDYAAAVAKTVLEGEAERGILLCGSGVGASVAANKFPGIRAMLCHDAFSARQGVEDDDANVMCMGARVVGPALALDLIAHYLKAEFSGAERHVRRLQKVADIEKECYQRYLGRVTGIDIKNLEERKDTLDEQ